MWYGFRSASAGAGGGSGDDGVGGTVPSCSPDGGLSVNANVAPGVEGEPGAPGVTIDSGPAVPCGPRRDGGPDGRRAFGTLALAGSGGGCADTDGRRLPIDGARARPVVIPRLAAVLAGRPAAVSRLALGAGGSGGEASRPVDAEPCESVGEYAESRVLSGGLDVLFRRWEIVPMFVVGMMSVSSGGGGSGASRSRGGSTELADAIDWIDAAEPRRASGRGVADEGEYCSFEAKYCGGAVAY
jgi:hypothetical protein